MIKKSVKAKGLQPEILLAIMEAREIYRDLDADLIITSLLDGKHMPNSFHYKGLAVDLRTRHISNSDRMLVVGRLRLALGPEYDVVLEKTHLHVEYDDKKV